MSAFRLVEALLPTPQHLFKRMMIEFLDALNEFEIEFLKAEENTVPNRE